MQIQIHNNPSPTSQTVNINQPNKKSKYPIFNYPTQDNPSRTAYYDSDPYSLHLSPSQPRLRPPPSTRNSH
jgi:hypothetical protein